MQLTGGTLGIFLYESFPISLIYMLGSLVALLLSILTYYKAVEMIHEEMKTKVRVVQTKQMENPLHVTNLKDVVRAEKVINNNISMDTEDMTKEQAGNENALFRFTLDLEFGEDEIDTDRKSRLTLKDSVSYILSKVGRNLISKEEIAQLEQAKDVDKLDTFTLLYNRLYNHKVPVVYRNSNRYIVVLTLVIFLSLSGIQSAFGKCSAIYFVFFILKCVVNFLFTLSAQNFNVASQVALILENPER